LSENRTRLDQRLVAMGLVATRSRARDLILRGCVEVDGQAARKPAMNVGDREHVRIVGEYARYVSRGALKLVAGLDAFGYSCEAGRFLDVGASTGGFTQVLLERGARSVVAVDVGHDQLAETVRTDTRVCVMEKTDARGLSPGAIQAAGGGAGAFDGLVADVSFISVTKILQKVLSLVSSGGFAVVLIKPQFEAGREAVGKGGIVRDEAVRMAAIEAVRRFVEERPGWRVDGVIESPLAGSDGNREALLGARRHD